MSFAHPAFLWALLAIAIPIIVHLFQFRRYRTLYFSDTRLLQEIQSENKRQSQLRKLVILALRILTIISAVMAFAQPYLHRQTDVFHTGSASIVLYIDNSFSMENSAEQGDLLNEAKNQAAAIADAFQEADEFMLLTNDLEGRHAHFTDRHEILEEIGKLQPSPYSRQMNRMFEYGLDMLDRQKGRNRQMFVLSDFQQSTTPLAKLYTDSNVLVRLVPLKPNKVKNIFIDSCWFETPLFLRGQECRLRFTVRNSGQDDIDQLPVKLYVNGQQKAIANTSVSANGKATAEISFMPDEREWQQAFLEINDHPVTFDDRFHFSFRTENRHKILSLCEPPGNPFLNALFSDDSIIAYSRMSLQQMDYSQLSEQNLVILDADGNPGDGCLNELKRYVENGGCLLVIPGKKAEQCLENKINRALELPSFTRLDTHRSRISGITMEHRLFANTMEKPTEQVRFPAVFRHYDLSKGLQSGMETLLSLENGDQFLGSYSLGKGCIYLLSVPLDDAFGEFHRHAIFIPAIYNMALFKNNPQEYFYSMGSNTPIPFDAGETYGDKMPELRNTALKFSCIPEIRNSYNSSELFIHDQIREAGCYALCSGEDTLQMISFNYDRRESLLEYWQDEALKSFCSEHKNVEINRLQHLSSAAVTEKIGGADRHNGLFIWLALAFLLAESLLLRLWKE